MNLKNRFFEFPPFFTRQPNQDTWMKQQELWIELILAYCKTRRQSFLIVNSQAEPFINPKISRSLSKTMIIELLDILVKDGRAEWTGKEKEKCIVYWNSPEEWASLIYAWVSNTGQIGGVVTLYEIINSEDTADQEFHQCDEAIIRKALDVLVRQGKAALFTSSDNSIGVKFN